MERANLDPRLHLLQEADIRGKTVLVRVDHNVVKKGKIKDPYRIDVTFPTLYTTVEKGGRPVLMTHIGRPKDKKTGKIKCIDDESVGPIVRYLEQKLGVGIYVPDFPIDPDKGIVELGSIDTALEDLKQNKIGMIYLPNTRWFQGEQAKGPERDSFTRWLASLADVFVNDAFGSWQAHASTYDIAKSLPSCAGLLLQKEIAYLKDVLEPQRPYLAVIAGAKYDTKIGPLKAMYEKADHLVLGGLLYNTYLSAKYGAMIESVTEEDRRLASDLVSMDEKEKKIIQTPYLVESDIAGSKEEGKYRTIKVDDLKETKKLQYLLDVDPMSLQQKDLKDAILSARTIFVNAVMGLMPHFFEGSQALYRLVMSNSTAKKLFGGGDTLQELRNLCPGDYLAGLDDPLTYYFTGGGSVLAAIQEGSPYKLKPVEALMESP
jgi:phosphoglycerate kinase